MVVRDLDPPDFLQLAGHPLRWRLLGELARSDRTVQELTGLVGEAQNLVSYHLAKLRGAGLVTTRRSSADGRDSYNAVDLLRVGALLRATGASLHPGLSVAPPTDVAPADVPPARVLFLCTGNSARSQIAEVLLQHRAGGAVVARSAGSHPKPLHPNAVRVMRERYGIDIGDRSSTHLDVVAGDRFDWVVTMCDKVREVCPELPGHPEVIHWSIADPSAGAGDLEVSYPTFERTATEIDTRVGFLLAVISASRP